MLDWEKIPDKSAIGVGLPVARWHRTVKIKSFQKRVRQMQSINIINQTREISDITAWDKNDQKLLVSKVRARDIQEDIVSKIKEIVTGEKEQNQVIVPYAMIATPKIIQIFTWNGEKLENNYNFSTSEVMSIYDQEFSDKRISESYLEALVEGWLRDLAYNWKSETPPKLEELTQIGLVPMLSETIQ